MFSRCFCAPFNRWRKPLMYSSSGSWCCWCISSNARKTSTRCFFSTTRSACSTRGQRRVSGCFQRFTGFYICGARRSPGGGEKSRLAFRDFSSLRLISGWLIVCIYAPFIRRYGAYCLIRNRRFEVPKNLRNDLSQRPPAIIVCRWVRDLGLSA